MVFDRIGGADLGALAAAPAGVLEGACGQGAGRAQVGAWLREVLLGVGGGRIDGALEELAEEAAAVGGVFAHSPKIRIAPAISSAMSG